MGDQDSVLKGFENKITSLKLQLRGSSSGSLVIWGEIKLTNFRARARGSGIGGNTVKEWKY